MRPRDDFHTTDPIEFNDRFALEDALTAIGGSVEGHCKAPTENKGDPCEIDEDCDFNGGDGRCGPVGVDLLPPLTLANQCTGYAEFVVALKAKPKGGFRKASAPIVLKTNPSADPITGKPRTPDADRMVLVCNPGP